MQVRAQGRPINFTAWSAAVDQVKSHISAFEKATGNKVNYENFPWAQYRTSVVTRLVGNAPMDVLWVSDAWLPEFAEAGWLAPIDDVPELMKYNADAAAYCTNSMVYKAKQYGLSYYGDHMSFVYNTELLQKAGFTAPPKTWDELKNVAKECTRDGNYGWVLNYGDPAGIGGTASYWMCFLQQAGGKLYNEDGSPAFNSDAGILALQMMMDLMPYSDPGSISYVGINDATNVMTAGKAAMMMNWPFMWKSANDPASSKIVGKLAGALLPAGPAGSASIDGTDAWTITKTSKNPELATKLIEFYLDKDVQKRQAIDTGWLPIRLSVLSDPDVQKALPNAAVVLEQANHPYDSYVTPDYNEVTVALGTEINKALAGKSSAKDAIAEAANLVAAIVKKRG